MRLIRSRIVYILLAGGVMLYTAIVNSRNADLHRGSFPGGILVPVKFNGDRCFLCCLRSLRPLGNQQTQQRRRSQHQGEARPSLVHHTGYLPTAMARTRWISATLTATSPETSISSSPLSV